MHRSLIVAVSAAALLAACGPRGENKAVPAQTSPNAVPDANPVATIAIPAETPEPDARPVRRK